MPSNVIKARVFETARHSAVVKRKLQIACHDANEILRQAEQEAQRILAEAQREAQQISKSAEEEGYERGAAQWYDLLAEAWASRDLYLADNELALLKLAVRIAEKLIGGELRMRPDAITGIVREAIGSVRRAKSVTVQVHPSHLTDVEQRVAEICRLSASGREFVVIPNASLSPGDCLVETDIGLIDARVDTQLKNMERALTLKTPS
jgi:type III secretion protein L